MNILASVLLTSGLVFGTCCAPALPADVQPEMLLEQAESRPTTHLMIDAKPVGVNCRSGDHDLTFAIRPGVLEGKCTFIAFDNDSIQARSELREINGQLCELDGTPFIFAIRDQIPGLGVRFLLAQEGERLIGTAQYVALPYGAVSDSDHWLEARLRSRAATSFDIQAGGFKPCEDVIAYEVVNNRSAQQPLRANEEGLVFTQFDPSLTGATGGHFYFMFKATRGSVSFTSAWGDQYHEALSRKFFTSHLEGPNNRVRSITGFDNPQPVEPNGTPLTWAIDQLDELVRSNHLELRACVEKEGSDHLVSFTTVAQSIEGECLLVQKNEHASTFAWERLLVQDGQVVCLNGAPFIERVSDIGPGQPITYYLVDSDWSIAAKVDVTPIPMHFVSDCGYQAEVSVYRQGEVTHTVLSGFEPNESIEITSTSGPETFTSQTRINSDGCLPVGMLPEVAGMSGGHWQMEVKGKKGSLSFQCPWGTAYHKLKEDYAVDLKAMGNG